MMSCTRLYVDTKEALMEKSRDKRHLGLLKK